LRRPGETLAVRRAVQQPLLLFLYTHLEFGEPSLGCGVTLSAQLMMPCRSLVVGLGAGKTGAVHGRLGVQHRSVCLGLRLSGRGEVRVQAGQLVHLRHHVSAHRVSRRHGVSQSLELRGGGGDLRHQLFGGAKLVIGHVRLCHGVGLSPGRLHADIDLSDRLVERGPPLGSAVLVSHTHQLYTLLLHLWQDRLNHLPGSYRRRIGRLRHGGPRRLNAMLWNALAPKREFMGTVELFERGRVPLLFLGARAARLRHQQLVALNLVLPLQRDLHTVRPYHHRVAASDPSAQLSAFRVQSPQSFQIVARQSRALMDAVPHGSSAVVQVGEHGQKLVPVFGRACELGEEGVQLGGPHVAACQPVLDQGLPSGLDL
jgi:hypothetical protein